MIENGTIFEPIFTNWTNTSLEHINVPVSDVILNNYSYNESNINNLITWTPPKGKFYKHFEIFIINIRIQ